MIAPCDRVAAEVAFLQTVVVARTLARLRW